MKRFYGFSPAKLARPFGLNALGDNDQTGPASAAGSAVNAFYARISDMAPRHSRVIWRKMMAGPRCKRLPRRGQVSTPPGAVL